MKLTCDMGCSVQIQVDSKQQAQASCSSGLDRNKQTAASEALASSMQSDLGLDNKVSALKACLQFLHLLVDTGHVLSWQHRS